MRINALQYNNTTFKGYNRSIANRFSAPDACITVMSLELNNVNSNDLNKWQNLQTKLWPNKQTTQTITIVEKNLFGRHEITVNDKPFKTIRNNANFSQKEESAVLELYTWLADLTKRIMKGEGSSYSNSQPLSTFQMQTFNNLLSQGYSNNTAYDIMHISQTKNPATELPPAANIVNDSIHSSMIEYFKD